MVTLNNFSDLNTALRNSFQAIKRDMQQLKEAQLIQIRGAKVLNQSLSDLKQDFVTKDQYNVLRIKMGDLNEEFKGLTRIKDDVARVEKRLEQEIKRLGEETTRKEDYKLDYTRHSEDITDLKKKTQEINKELRKTTKEIRFKQLVAEIKEEFSSVRKEINYVERTGGHLVEDKFNQYVATLNRRVDDLKEDIKRLQQYSKVYVNTAQAEQLVQDVNIEFDKVKDSITKLAERQKDFVLKEDFEKKISQADKKFEERIKSFNDQIVKIEKELEKQKDFVTETQAEVLVNDINKEFDRINDRITEVNGIRTEFKKLEKRALDKAHLDKQVDGFERTVERLTDNFDTFRKSSLSNERLTKEVRELKKGVRESVEISDYEKQSKRFDSRLEQLNGKIRDIVPISKHEREITKLDSEIKKLKLNLGSTVDAEKYEKEISRLNSQVYALREEIAGIKQQIKQVAKIAGKAPPELKIKVKGAGFFAAWRARRAAKKAQRRIEKLKARKLKEARKLEKLRAKEVAKLARLRGLKPKKVKKEKPKKIKEKRPLRKLYVFANTLIFLSFCLLGGSLGAFFYEAADLMDILALSAIIIFIFGIILRLFVILKRK